MSYEYFYPGTPYSLEPTYGDVFSGYRMAAGKIGLTTDPRTANQLQEVSNKINPGATVVDVEFLSPKIMDSIPKQHLKEINRLSKLTGTELSVHGPAVEASGYTDRGWNETERKLAEKQIMAAVERAKELDDKGNIPVTMHPSYMLPSGEVTIKEKVGGEYKELPKSVLMIDSRTGELMQIKEQEKFFPEKGFTKEFKPELEIKKRNEELWARALNELSYYSARSEDYIDHAFKIVAREGMSEEEAEKKTSQILKAYASGSLEMLPEEERKLASPILRELTHGHLMLKDSYNNLKELYNRVYKDASENDRKKLDEYKKEITPIVQAGKGIEKEPEKLREFARIVEKGVKLLGGLDEPKLYQPFNQFITDKTSDTFSNVAFQAYQKFGEKAPLLNIENAPIGSALSRAGELKKLIETTREKFVKRAKEEGISESQAKSAAEKLIGATWDVGHINMLRRYGYDKTDIIKESEKIAPFVKHVHLSDNFGFEHTELPMGMGNVPLKEIMEKLGKQGEDAKKIVEAAQWYEFFKTLPLTESYEASGSPLFKMRSPYWNQMASGYGNYFAFPSSNLPEQHFALYGGGFSSLPAELGGQIPGRQSRVSGTPMA